MKLTKQQTKKHNEAMELVNLSRKLTDFEVMFILENFHPGASNNISQNGAFFTPLTLASDLATFAYPTADPGSLRYIDACAGIGTLSKMLLEADSVEHKITEIVAIESNLQYVKIGRKILPQVTWVHGSIFNLELLEQLGLFDIGVSNPPYGTVSSNVSERSWLPFEQPAHMAVAAVLSHVCKRGAELIIPVTDHDQTNSISPYYYDNKHRRAKYSSKLQATSLNYTRFKHAYPHMTLVPDPVDCSKYAFKGANPAVSVVSLNPTEHTNPYYGQFNAKTVNLKLKLSIS